MFHSTVLDLGETNLFDLLADPNLFTIEAKGRKCGILIDSKNGLIPIVRTTTIYDKPPHKFSDIHHNIIENVKRAVNMPNLKFNNAMIEMYNCEYRTMKFHTDQALDLADDSYICVFSCYNNPVTQDIRKLRIKNKTSGKIDEIIMAHNSIIIFSTQINKEHIHQIVLEKESFDRNTIWLGITFRLSKTFVNFIIDEDGGKTLLLFPGGRTLRLANNTEKSEFFILKGEENTRVDFTYPQIDYTISDGDLMSVK